MSSVRSKIQAIVPKSHSKFKKLRGGDPYHFLAWDKGYLRYWFWDSGKTYKNTKRVPLTEIEAAAKECLAKGLFDRAAFSVLCPIAAGDGPCGFAVIS